MSPESQVTFRGGSGLALQGVLCGDPAASPTVVTCYPFADERKCSQRAYVLVARALATHSIASLRFDYSGCGNSEGRFGQQCLTDWIADTVCAFDLCRRGGATILGAMGVRLGASIALAAAESYNDCRHLLLWNPVTDGRAYLAAAIRRNRVLRMFGADQPEGREDSVAAHDMAGYSIGPRLAEQLQIQETPAPEILMSDPRIRLGRASPDEFLKDDVQESAAILHARVGAFWDLSHIGDVEAFVRMTVDYWVALWR